MSYQELFYNIVLAILSTIGGIVLTHVKQYVLLQIKQLNHLRGSSVIEDAVIEIFHTMDDEWKRAFLDNKLTKEDFEHFKKAISNVVEARLKELFGFYKKDLQKWINERIDATIPKLFTLFRHSIIKTN